MRSFFANLKSASSGACVPCIDAQGQVTQLLPFCFLDTANYSYQDWLVNTPKQLADLSQAKVKIAIIGSGPAGVSLAFELLRAGCRDFTVFEATDRIGGRFYSYALDEVNRAELGAMRFPPTENCLYWYIQYLQQAYKARQQPHAITLNPNFPDPGLVPTLVSYRDQLLAIMPGGPTPPEFKTVSDGWNAFATQLNDIILGDGTTLAAPARIMAWLDKSQPAQYNPILALNAWQGYLNTFKDKSFEAGVIDIFCQPQAPGGNPWKYPQDLDIFGTVGTGIGGYAPLFEISFCELMRFIFNRLEECHAQIVTGTDSVINGLADCHVNGGTDTVRAHIKLNTPVGHIVPSPDGRTSTLRSLTNTLLGEGFTHVVVATTHNAAQIDLRIDPRWQSPAGQDNSAAAQIVPMNLREAISNVHMGQSSKFFIKVKPWWRGPANQDRIRCITTDTPMENFYTLDYSPTSPEAVCLMNYVWEDVSEKTEALGDIDTRYQRFLEDLRKVAGGKYQYILDSMPAHATQDNAVMIDWQLQKHYYGAFMLNHPSQEYLLSTLFYNYLTRKDLAKVYFIGDSFHFIGGWVEGAFQTALNVFCAISESAGVTVNNRAQSPLILNPSQLIYDNPPNNAQVTSFGPHGGTGGDRPFSAEITPGTPVTLYADPTRIRGIQIGTQVYGVAAGAATRIPPADLQKITALQVLMFIRGSESNTGRVRCLKINGHVYGATPQSDDIPYCFNSTNPCSITRIMGTTGLDVDRIGGVLAKPAVA